MRTILLALVALTLAAGCAPKATGPVAVLSVFRATPLALHAGEKVRLQLKGTFKGPYVRPRLLMDGSQGEVVYLGITADEGKEPNESQELNMSEELTFSQPGRHVLTPIDGYDAHHNPIPSTNAQPITVEVQP